MRRVHSCSHSQNSSCFNSRTAGESKGEYISASKTSLASLGLPDASTGMLNDLGVVTGSNSAGIGSASVESGSQTESQPSLGMHQDCQSGVGGDVGDGDDDKDGESSRRLYRDETESMRS